MKRLGPTKRTGGAILVAMVACGSLAATIAEHGALGSVDEEPLRPVPVVMIVLDELPVATLMDETGEVDEDLFPNFARIQRDSTWFRNTTTPAMFTKEAVPAILTGLYPDNPRSDRRSVFDLVNGTYDIPLTHEHHVLERAPSGDPDVSSLRGVCPSSACEHASASMMRLFERYGRLFPGGPGEEFLRFLSIIRGDDQPRFYFLHYVMPHQPWRSFPTGQAYTKTTFLPGQVNAPGPGKEWIDNRWLVMQAYQRHLLQTSLLDRQLGVLIDHLEARDIYDQSLIAITADHGVAFAPGESKRVVTPRTVGHLSPVPFFIKQPFQDAGRISDRPVETVDVVPTLIDALASSDVPLETDGVSALASDFPTQRVRKTDYLELPRDLDAKFSVAEIKYDTFGYGKRGIDLFSVAPGGTESMLGRRIGRFEMTSPADAGVVVENIRRVEKARPAMPLLPALVEGALEGRGARGQKIVVAIDGEVVAVTKSYRNPRGAN
ncbi:MAG: sulfatase-like hydrolase/transferase, partial [Actinomycetota bacterium]|nr:sulfatase-like hydrolase/transferase [Actinomycetota bacterium]